LKTRRHIQTIPYETIHGKVRMNPSAGFSLWNERILFTGLGFEGPPPSFEQPAQALTLFSTGLDGRDLTVLERETLSVSARPGRTLFGFGFSAPVSGGGMAVCQAIPSRLILLGPGGKVLRTKAVPGFEVPVVPREVLAHEDLQADLLATTPHVTGLFTLNAWIALVIERPSPAGPHLSVSWFTSNLDPIKEEGIELPVQLSKWDVVTRVIHVPPDSVLFLVQHREPGAVPSARLYKSQVK
jgi:hypothetical protein